MRNFQGEIAALVAAMLWAGASVLYGRVGTSIPPLHLNLIKGIVAIVLLLITIIASGDLFPALAPQQAGLLLISGVMGIGLGDTAFLAAINSLGARRVLLLETLAPPITAIFAFVFLQESLNASAWCGVLLTILGVAWVTGEGGRGKGERGRGKGEGGGVGGVEGVEEGVDEEYIYASPSPPSPSSPSSPSFYKGVGFALLAAVGNAAGAVLSRGALANSNINPLWAALLRLSGAVFLLLPWILWQQKHTITTLVPYWKSRKIVAATCFAAFCGTFLGIWLQQIAIKFTAAGIASTLLQTSPVFVLPLAIWTGEKVSLRAVAGVAIAIAGIALLFYLK